MTRSARWLGRILQALVLGYLLFVAVLQIYATGSGATVFEYQGF